jgi:hypothetical protein
MAFQARFIIEQTPEVFGDVGRIRMEIPVRDPIMTIETGGITMG